MAAISQLVKQGNSALAQQLGERGGAVLDGFRQGGRTAVQRVSQGRGATIDDRAEFERAVLEHCRNRRGTVLKRDVEARRAVVEGRQQMARALIDQRYKALGPLAERAVQRIAGGLEGLGQVAARFDDGAGDALRDHVEIEDEPGVALGDRFTHALGVGDHSLALAGELLDQGAHARFIV